ncbi:MAG: hypothetical protein PHN68_03290 [Prolixibacteraceae bacterium]|jgi:hypothetical protein|nr:hypothetical protein [Prolixibacteraceae bacterium]MDD4755597.1 hypothetical protein [Prolixibacteraceae bacterium]
MKAKKYLLIPFALFLSFCITVQVASGQKAPEKIFKAGAAKSNITPFLGEGIIGGWNPPPATHIHDELHARCLVLDDGETKLAFIIIDNCIINRELYDEARRIINEETGLPGANVLMSTVHTHSATSSLGGSPSIIEWKKGKPFNEYQNFVVRRIADVVRIAINNLEPARIGWGKGNVPEHVFIRRWKMKPGTPMPNPLGGEDQVVMNPGVENPNLLEPAGEPDTEVSFISVQSADGRPLALLANYSLHYVGGVPVGHISADYFAIFADRIQELLKADRQDPPFIGIMSNGTSGDANNINFRGPVEKNPPYAKMKKVADDVAREVYRVHNKITFHDWVPLKAAASDLNLEVRKPDKDMVTRAENVLNRPETVKSVHRLEKIYAEFMMEMLDWPDNIEIMLQTFRIGDLGIAAIPFEVFAATGMEIKTKSPFDATFTIELANGWYGYLPTPEQHELSGYETWLGSNRVEKEASTKIVNTLMNLFDTIKK